MCTLKARVHMTNLTRFKIPTDYMSATKLLCPKYFTKKSRRGNFCIIIYITAQIFQLVYKPSCKQQRNGKNKTTAFRVSLDLNMILCCRRFKRRKTTSLYCFFISKSHSYAQISENNYMGKGEGGEIGFE